MSNDSSSRTGQRAEYTAPALPAAAMYCSECKSIMRLSYFSLNERPLCTGCAGTYRDRIERGIGPGSMGRAVLYGTGAAIGGMIGLAIVLSVFNAFRIVSSIAVAYLVAKAIGKATGNYGGRRYQVLAVALTYAALGLGMLIPVMRAAERLDEVKAPPKLEARNGPAGESAEFDDEMRSLNSAPREGEDPAVAAARADSLAAADSVARLARTRANVQMTDLNARFAERLERPGITIALGAVALLFVLPILSSFAYGLYAGVISIFALVFARRKAWELTEVVMEFELTGPFKVGTGPIPPAFGR